MSNRQYKHPHGVGRFDKGPRKEFVSSNNAQPSRQPFQVRRHLAPNYSWVKTKLKVLDKTSQTSVAGLQR
jgi:hypothetical protein